jgi:hypothetical protein
MEDLLINFAAALTLGLFISILIGLPAIAIWAIFKK